MNDCDVALLYPQSLDIHQNFILHYLPFTKWVTDKEFVFLFHKMLDSSDYSNWW